MHGASKKMILRYGDIEFEFDCPAGLPLSGRLQLNEGQRAHLRVLLESEPDDWFLDRNGERLPAEQLFSLSPWSCEPSSGIRKKLLKLFINLDTGEAIFSAVETYGGETFSFLRSA
jgi:hypothetical protein